MRSNKVKVKIVDLIRKEGREPGGYEPGKSHGVRSLPHGGIEVLPGGVWNGGAMCVCDGHGFTGEGLACPVHPIRGNSVVAGKRYVLAD